MIRMRFDLEERSPRTILCLGAHCDDIEIGCGGTILKLSDHYPGLRIHWVVLSSDPVRAKEGRRSAEVFLEEVGEREIVIKGFRDGFLPYEGQRIKEYFESLKTISPDIIFTHCRHDLHQDHRLISELTWNSFRNHLILEYEIPKYDGDLGSPNVYVGLDEVLCRRKVRHIFDCFVSQRDKDFFAEETFLALMRLRGMESRAEGGYAEGFYCRKMLL